jgi:hypothetical protein
MPETSLYSSHGYYVWIFISMCDSHVTMSVKEVNATDGIFNIKEQGL